jgi:polar amino acid transport system substrate-binding protein
VSADRVRIVTGEWAPYISAGFAQGGIACHLAREAFARAGLAVEIEFTMPWLDGVYELAKAGRFDATLAWRPTPARREHFLASAEPVMENRYVLFHRKDLALDWRRFSDLRPHAIAGTRGFNYGERFRRAEAEGAIEVRWSDTPRESFERLLRGEVALVAHDQGVGQEDLRASFGAAEVARIGFHPRMTDHHLSHVIFPRRNPERSRALCQAFDRCMAELRAGGEIPRWIEAFKAGRYGNAPFPGEYWTLESPRVALEER